MRLEYLAVSAIATMLGAFSLAMAAPGGTENIKYKYRFDRAEGCQDDGVVHSCFEAKSYDNMDGTETGTVYVEWHDGVTPRYIFCTGPSYANAVKVQGSGRTSVRAILVPNDGSCFPYNVTAPIELSLDGLPDGTCGTSSQEKGWQTFNGTTFRYKGESDLFCAEFDGLAPLFNNFRGEAERGKRDEYERYK